MILPDGRTLVPSKSTNKRQHTKGRYGWESSRQSEALKAPGGRFWYHAVIDPRTKELAPTGCITVAEVPMFRNVGPGFPKTDSVETK
jgi:hypothetical protein